MPLNVKPAQSRAKRVLGFSAILLMSLGLASCDLATNYQKSDRGSNMEIQDFRDGMEARLPSLDDKSDSSKKGSGSIPSLQPYMAQNTETLKPMPLVSVSVNQSVPIRDVLFELAEQADYDLELDPNIKGSIIFTARNKPFDQVIERISDMAGLRYKFEDEHLRVEMDTPYNKLYKIDYLSFIRQNTSSVATNVSVVSGEGADTGSAFSATSNSTADFWGELDLNLAQILGGAKTGVLATKNDPRITAVEKTPDVEAVAPEPKEGEEGKVNVQPPEAVLKVESLPVDDASASSGAVMTDDEAEALKPTFSINKQAGIINVYATEKLHKQVQEYLVAMRKAVTSQVLIEAKIFEVSLSDEYITGIDWGAIDLSSGEGFVDFISDGGATALNNLASHPGTALALTPSGTIANASNFAIGYAGNDFQGLLQAVSGFGTVRALASPRLTVLNNQSAVLNVATNKVYFEIKVDSSTEEGVTEVDVDSDIKSVPEGVLVNVQPSINLENNTISLAVRPTVTRIVGSVSDPSVAFVAASVSGAEGIVSEIPEVNVQEIDTVIQVRSGQPIVMGGLLQDRATNSQQGIPVLGEAPIVGSLFRKKSDFIEKTELVIFLKATLIDAPEETIHPTDRDLYKTYSGDRRPFKL